MKNLFKVFTVCMLAFALVLAACGSGQTNGGSEAGEAASTAGTNGGDAAQPSDTAAQEKSYEPLAMTWMYRGTDTEEAAVKLLKDEVKKRWNVDLTIELVDSTVYADKLKVAWAAGNQADFVMMDDKKMIYDAVRNNAVLPLDDFIAGDPAWSSLPKSYYVNAVVDGKTYSLPTYDRIPEVFYYRADWLDKLKLSLPTTADELYAVLKAFAKEDPDGNGKPDTYGFTMEQDFTRTDAIFNLFLPAGPPPKNLALYLDPQDDTIKSSWLLTDNMKQALTWLNTAYKEGVLDPEWALDKKSTAEDKFLTGKTGMWVKGAQWIVPRQETISAKFPEAELATMPVIPGKYGPNYGAPEGFTTEYFMTNSVKDPERGAQVLGFLLGKEGISISRLGQEGVTYKVEDGKLVWLDEAMGVGYNPGALLTAAFEIQLPVPETLLETSIKNVAGNAEYPNLEYYSGQSDLALKKVTDIDKLAKEYLSKIIMGNYGIDQYDEFIGKLKDMGIEDILADVNKIYQADK